MTQLDTNTIGKVRNALKSGGELEYVSTDEFDELCRLAISKLMPSTEWLHRELTDEEIINAMRECWKDKP